MAALKKITVASCLLACTVVGVSTTSRFGDDDNYTKKNLQVMPKSISLDDLELFMTRYTREIGASCLYCHVQSKPGIVPESTDYASDEKPEKKIAREMMKMTNRINRKYFGVKNNYEALLKLPVTCKTCHRGITRPNQNKLF